MHLQHTLSKFVELGSAERLGIGNERLQHEHDAVAASTQGMHAGSRPLPFLGSYTNSPPSH